MHAIVRGSPERDISSLGGMGQGPGASPDLFACRRVRLLVEPPNVHDCNRAATQAVGREFVCIWNEGGGKCPKFIPH